MTLTVHLFAAARELVGSPTIAVHLDDGATIADLKRALTKPLGDLLPKCAIAVNHEFVSDAVRLVTTDEVAVIPPVNGGLR